jgi:peroxin-3
MVYLTLSWWILHVGWKDVGERVRREVEEVFDGCVFNAALSPSACIETVLLERVFLETKIGSMDLFRLIGDIHRRVEQ